MLRPLPARSTLLPPLFPKQKELPKPGGLIRKIFPSLICYHEGTHWLGLGQRRVPLVAGGSFWKFLTGATPGAPSPATKPYPKHKPTAKAVPIIAQSLAPASRACPAAWTGCAQTSPAWKPGPARPGGLVLRLARAERGRVSHRWLKRGPCCELSTPASAPCRPPTSTTAWGKAAPASRS